MFTRQAITVPGHDAPLRLTDRYRKSEPGRAWRCPGEALGQYIVNAAFMDETARLTSEEPPRVVELEAYLRGLYPASDLEVLGRYEALNTFDRAYISETEVDRFLWGAMLSNPIALPYTHRRYRGALSWRIYLDRDTTPASIADYARRVGDAKRRYDAARAAVSLKAAQARCEKPGVYPQWGDILSEIPDAWAWVMAQLEAQGAE